MRKIIHATRQVGRGGFADMLDEVEGHIGGHQGLLRSKELGNLQSHLQRKGENDDEEKLK